MPPVPHVQQVQGGSNRIVAGYIAAQLLRGVYTSTSAYSLASEPDDVSTIKRAYAELERAYAQLLLSFFIRHAHPTRSRGQSEMRAVLRSLRQHAQSLEVDPGTSTTSRIPSILPQSLDAELDRILANPQCSSWSRADAHVLALARWFKRDYMKWIDPIPCPRCGGKTQGTGGAQPTDEERRDGAGRVELHACIEGGGCGGRRRFCRYGKVETLLRTREGRCGEWAHLFYVFLRAAGFEARYVWNSEDHVWTEYWSEALQHWVHVDPCEAAVSKPLLYARGWGKKQAFCIAAGPYGYEDVTPAYVDDFAESCLSRRRTRGWSESLLKHAILEETIALRLDMSEEERIRLESMDDMQALWIGDEARRLAEAEQAELGGRVSGPEEWRKVRGELGEETIVRPNCAVVRSIHRPGDSVYTFGDARPSGEGFVLTDGSSQTSAVFADKGVSPSCSFRCVLKLRMTSPPGAGEADGMALVFCRDRALGGGGYGLGYSGLGGEGDFAIEIDTYRSQDHADDPPTPHISVHSPPHAHHRHSIACTSAGSIPFLSDGRVYTLEVVFDASTRVAKGWLGLPDAEAELGVFEVKIPAGTGDAEWKAGVTASCGGLWQKQEVIEWTIEEIDLSVQAHQEEEVAKMPDAE